MHIILLQKILTRSTQSEEASRVRERLAQVEQASRAIQEKAAAVEFQGRQQQMREVLLQDQV